MTDIRMLAADLIGAQAAVSLAIMTGGDEQAADARRDAVVKAIFAETRALMAELAQLRSENARLRAVIEAAANEGAAL